MIIKREKQYWTVQFEKDDWESGLAKRINEVIKSLPKKHRYFSIEKKLWYVYYTEINIVNKAIRDFNEFTNKEVNKEDSYDYREVDDFEDIFKDIEEKVGTDTQNN